MKRIHSALALGLVAAGSVAAMGLARPAVAGTCWYETAYYEKWGCKIQQKLNNGKYVLLCCN